jgi:subtilisin family serine protease
LDLQRNEGISMGRRVGFGLVLALACALVLAAAPAVAGAGERARYIVVLEDSVPSAADVARQHARAHGAEPFLVYGSALKGYAALVPSGRLGALRSDPRVAFVERDQRVGIASQTVPTGVKRIFADTNANLDLDGTDDVRVDADVAVIDTGIDHTHADLNVVGRTNCSGGGPTRQQCTDGAGEDGNGHGTHVAGTIAAIDNGSGVVGVAPGARLWAVKVLDNSGSGWTSWIIAGIDWVTANAATVEVANMSLGCECSSAAQDAAISNSVAAGVVYVVAAGNSNKDARTFSPANHPDVVTVSALADFDGVPGGAAAPTCRSDQDDTLASFSNWGPRIDVAAPGVCILSTWKGGGYNTISGTSMASPHAAGAAALLASKSKPTNRTQALAIRAELRNQGNFDWTDDSRDGIKEPLLDVGDTTVFAPRTVAGPDSGGGGGGGEPPPDDGLVLSASGYKVKGVQHADLAWSGSSAASFDVYRDGARITTVSGTSHVDNLGKKGSGTYAYRVCEAGTTTCSGEAIVVF